MAWNPPAWMEGMRGRDIPVKNCCHESNISFEVIKPADSEGRESPSAERQATFDERIGGPLKPNDLLTTATNEAKPILEQLGVHYKTSLCTPEKSLGGTAFVPAEYRIEVMDPNAPHQPAPEPYVQFVFDTLRKARVPISKASPASRNSEDN